MASILKVLGTERACNTQANSYSSGNLVRLTHAAASTAYHTVTCKDSGGNTLWTCAIVGGQEIFVVKNPTDTLETEDTGTSVRAVPVAYRNN